MKKTEEEKQTATRITNNLNVPTCLIFLAIFCVATLVMGDYYLAAAEAAIVLVLVIYSILAARRRAADLEAYVESVTYDAETAKNNTLQHFPLPMAVFRLVDTTVVWGNQMFFDICGIKGPKSDHKLSQMVPQFDGKWLIEGKKTFPGLLEVNGHKYQVNGNLIRTGDSGEKGAFLGITYWVDLTDYDAIRVAYEKSRPVVGVLSIDNYEEMMKNQTDRNVSDLRDSVEDKLMQWAASLGAIVRRTGRDRYLMVMEEQSLEQTIADKFSILSEVQSVVNTTGVHATLSIGIGHAGTSYDEDLQFAGMSLDMALSRGGDQAVVKDKFNFSFYGGKGVEVETRTMVRSRVMAEVLSKLIKDASRVIVMGHRFADMDTIGAAVGVCCIARKAGVECRVAVSEAKCPAKPMIDSLRPVPQYRSMFVSPKEAMSKVDGRTLMVLVDTSRPEMCEDQALLEACSHVVVLDHHRRAASYVQNADLSYIEPHASSACELLTEMLEVLTDPGDILKCEANALLTGIMLDTKSFTLHTGDRTFDAAAFLKRMGAEPTEAKKMMQTNMESTLEKYRILQHATMYRNVGVAVEKDPVDRIIAAQAADDMLGIQGVDASVVVFPVENGTFMSARSLGSLNVQILMEKLGGGGSRNAAAAQMEGVSVEDAVTKLKAAVDDYLDN